MKTKFKENFWKISKYSELTKYLIQQIVMIMPNILWKDSYHKTQGRPLTVHKQNLHHHNNMDKTL